MGTRAVDLVVAGDVDIPVKDYGRSLEGYLARALDLNLTVLEGFGVGISEEVFDLPGKVRAAVKSRYNSHPYAGCLGL